MTDGRPLLSRDAHAESWNVTLVDNNPLALQSLARAIGAHGFHVETFPSPEAFLSAFAASPPEILVVDLQLPWLDGLALQDVVRRRGSRVPTILVLDHGDVATSVAAFRSGAIDILEKPWDDRTILESLLRATAVARAERAKHYAVNELIARLKTLTPREREVFRLVVTGRLNKQIAAEIGITEKTAKVHRARVVAKMQAHSLVELVRIFDRLNDVLSGNF